MSLRTVVLFLLATGSVSAAPVPKEVSRQTDAERFVGTWETVVSESGGKPYSKARWTFAEDLKMTSNPLPGAEGGTSEWVIKIDPKAKPKTIDIGGYPGIYDFDGAEIRIAYAVGGERPTELSSKGSQFYSVLRRVPEGKK